MKTKPDMVAIVGRANVGKSTLFNRMASGTKALVSSTAGTTRDRHEARCHWAGRSFILVDTGGLDLGARETVNQKIEEQARAALADAAAVLFVVDAHDGVMPADKHVAALLRTLKQPVILVANKVDNERHRASLAEFYRLGLGDPQPVSAATSAGTGDLLDVIVTKIKTRPFKETSSIPIAIVGKPNVGKSSLLNALLGNERAIVDEKPYTTRDVNEIHLTYKGTTLALLDTAGIRKKTAVAPRSLEAESLGLSLASISRAAVTILVTEAQAPLTAQDRHIASKILESNSSLIIIGNKWDLVEKGDPAITKRFTDYYRRELNFISWAPLLLLSAEHKTNMTALKDTILMVHNERFRRITDNALGKLLAKAVKRQPPTTGRGTRRPFIRALTQVDVNPPQFAVRIDPQTSLRYTYLNFLERMLREQFGFEGAPVKLWVQKPRKGSS